MFLPQLCNRSLQLFVGLSETVLHRWGQKDNLPALLASYRIPVPCLCIYSSCPTFCKRSSWQERCCLAWTCICIIAGCTQLYLLVLLLLHLDVCPPAISAVWLHTSRIMKIAWVTYPGALSRLNAILIPRISAHPPILAQCKVHRPWALFREGTVIQELFTLSWMIRYACQFEFKWDEVFD